MLRGIALLLICMNALLAQQRGVPRNLYYRVWAVVPISGTGLRGDVKRPMLVPAPSAISALDRTGVLGYQMQVSDDGQSAIVEYVFANRAAYQDALAKEAAARGIAVSTAVPTGVGALAAQPSQVGANQGGTAPTAPPSATDLTGTIEAAVPGVKLFTPGRAAQAAMEAELKRHKANFTFTGVFPVRVQ